MTRETIYNAEVTTRMNDSYIAAESDEARAQVVNGFAAELGVSVASVRSKLVNLGVYKAKARVAKNGEAIESKAKIVADIAKIIGVEEEAVESLEKATKPVLKAVRSFMLECEKSVSDS